MKIYKIFVFIALSLGFSGCGDDDDDSAVSSATSDYACKITLNATSNQIFCIQYEGLPTSNASAATTACSDNYGGDASQTGTFEESASCLTGSDNNALGSCVQSSDNSAGATTATAVYYSSDSIFTAASAEADCTTDGGTWAATSLN